MTETPSLPNYFRTVDFEGIFAAHPPPEDYALGMHLWPRERVRAHQDRLFRDVVANAWTNPFYKQRWAEAGIEPGDINSLDDLEQLPIVTVDDFKESIEHHPPFGLHQTLADQRPHQPVKVQSSGGTTGRPRPTLFSPLEWEVQGIQTARAMYMQGARPGDVMQIPVTLSTANLGWCYFQACFNYLGVMVITTGSGLVTPSRRQIEDIQDWHANLLVAFPEYLLTLGRTAQEMGIDPHALGMKMLTTYLGPDTEGQLRREMEALWGCPVFDNYGTHEIGVASFECEHREGLHFNEDTIYVEVADVDTGVILGPGNAGNLVATSLHRRNPPLIRYNLMDRIELYPEGKCNCGSQSLRMNQFLGRSDDMVKIKGTNVYPMACLNAIKGEPAATGEWICVVDRIDTGRTTEDRMTVQVECDKIPSDPEAVASRLQTSLRNDLGVGVLVELVALGELDHLTNRGREGKVRRLLDRRPEYARRY